MSQEAILKAAVPSLAAAVEAAGGTVINAGAVVAAAMAKKEEETLKAVVDKAVPVLQSVASLIFNTVQQINKDEAALTEKKKYAAELAKLTPYFTATSNLYPAMEAIGIKTSPETLKAYPNLNKVPEGWTVPVAPVAAAATQASAQ